MAWKASRERQARQAVREPRELPSRAKASRQSREQGRSAAKVSRQWSIAGKALRELPVRQVVLASRDGLPRVKASHQNQVQGRQVAKGSRESSTGERPLSQPEALAEPPYDLRAGAMAQRAKELK